MEADLPIYGLACPELRQAQSEFDTQETQNCRCMKSTKKPPILLLQGIITDSKTKAPFEAGLVNVYNVTRGTGTLPDAKGMYELQASYNDEIRISFVGYKTVTLKASELPKAIELQEQTESLDEVIITGKKKNYMVAGLGLTAILLMYVVAEDDKGKKKKVTT
ncbi:carboxypeptidase-like protein [Tenacibaculum skagerrakense]|uniref:Carboxypeptidase-like protein n=1 Tax=Tenacibaculum skagerrakense TaxID=186571 RepID=A0A4R2NM77_9FLAO|nr:carboxypeptidase-like regulatory domain-containing protein [Tenacibaculum skagerrakense]TCP22388.1 carboxypeptidase-like protein [Tenacibaculum skagerrakense]